MFCYRKAKRIVALTEGIRNNIIAKGIAPDKVVLITNGVDPALFEHRPAGDVEQARMRQKMGFENHFICMYLGAHGDYNALDTILDAADALRGDPRYLCVLVGDGDNKPHLQALAQERGLTNVRFLPPVSRVQSPVLLHVADVFLLPNRRGELYTMNLPNKLFDFLASQRPIIVAGRGESANLVQRAGAGRVVEAEDGIAMAQAIVALATLSTAERTAMGEGGRRYALEHYNREDLSHIFLDTLEHALQSG
jgi:glycosyltransferase involved in cell wall biosynthesis